jgi:hypothetical protein
MAKNDASPGPSFERLGKCECCKGQNGKAKDIYETLQSARDAARSIEQKRGVFLNPYKCPRGSGWHLTKSNADCGLVEGQETIFTDNFYIL